MTTLAITSAGTTLAISSSLPATYNAVGFSALSYTTIAEVTDMGEFGKEYNTVDHSPVNDRKVYTLKANYKNGTMSISLAKATSDAGQTLLLAASNSDADYSFHLTFQDGTDAYFTAKTLSFKTNVGSASSILGATAQLVLNSDIVETA